MQQDTGASILVTEMPIPKDKAQQVLEQFSSAAAFKARGMRLIEAQAITISGIPGKLLLLSQSNQLEFGLKRRKAVIAEQRLP